MDFLFYPNENGLEYNVPYEKAEGVVGKEIKKLKKKHENIYLLVKLFLDKIREVENLDVFYRTGEIKGLGDGLSEIRIPKQKRGGVFRIYFCMSKSRDDLLIFLYAEFKHSKEGGCVDMARKKQKEYSNGKRRI